MSQTEQYDAIVIGAGQAGGPLASALAGAGKKTAIIERKHVGGTCVNEGCTPTKTMVASARVAYLARRGADYGVQTGPISLDMSVVRRRKRDIVASFRSGSQNRLMGTKGVDLLLGEGYFVGPHTIEVRFDDGQIRRLQADLICINAGDRPAPLRIKGADGVDYLDSTSIMELDQVPSHLLILGGGYIGVEFGQMFRRFGSQVTIVQHGKQLLKEEDSDIAEEVAKIFREDGIELLLGSRATRVARSTSGEYELTVQSDEGEKTLIGSHLLTATGRVPNSDTLHLETAGIECDERGYIRVNDRLETNIPGIYALGDIKGGPAFTHISYDDYRILRTNLIEHGSATIKDRLLLYTIFIDPQLGRVGLNETEARRQGRKIKIAKMPMTYVARALETDETRGMMKAIVDAENNQLLGATVLGLEGGELMSMLEIAMLGKLPYTVLRDAVLAHPTLAESLNNLFNSFE